MNRRVYEYQKIGSLEIVSFDASVVQQDFYRRVVAEYRAHQRRRQLFREILWTMYFAVIASAALVYVLRAVGLL